MPSDDKKDKAVKPAADEVKKSVKPKAPKKAEDAPAVNPIGSSSKPVSEPVKPLGAAQVAPAAPRFKVPTNWRSMLVTGLSVLVIVLVLVTVAFGVLVYGYKSESPVVAAVAKVIPYPAERVNGHYVSYSDYLFQLSANKRGYAQNAKLNNQPAVNYNSADGKKILAQFRSSSLDKIKSDAVVAQLASKNKVTVSNKDVDTLISQLYKNYGGKDTLLKTLKDIYGWDIGDLRSVVRKQLLEQKLSQKVTSDPAVDAAAKAKATDIAKKIKDGGDFAALAKQYSQASDSASGGDLGSFTKGQVSDEIQKAVDALPVGGVSDPIKDQYGYEIIKVTDKSGDTYKASHILIKTVDFTDYLNQQIKAAKFNQYIKV